MLDELLAYRETPPEDPFVADVMRRVERQRRLRRWILAGAGAVGTVFGAVGAVMLSGPLAAAFSGDGLTLAVVVVAVGAALAWLLQDEVVTGG